MSDSLTIYETFQGKAQGVKSLFEVAFISWHTCLKWFNFEISPYFSCCPELFSIYKLDNLQYNTLDCLINGMNDSSTKCLMFKALFSFIISYRLRALKTLYFHWNNFCKEFCKKLGNENNTWNINESFVPATQQPSIPYWRLLDFFSRCPATFVNLHYEKSWNFMIWGFQRLNMIWRLAKDLNLTKL